MHVMSKPIKNNSAKRNRWASSSDEDDDTKQRNQKSITKRKAKETGGTCTIDNSTNVTDDHHQDHENKPLQDVAAAAAAAAIPTTTSLNSNMLSSLINQTCRSINDTYNMIDRISEGSYGIVWKARYKSNATSTTKDDTTNNSNAMVAIKQLKLPSMNTNDRRNPMIVAADAHTVLNRKQKDDDDGDHNNNISNWKDDLPLMVIREINALAALRNHPNIVTLLEIVIGSSSNNTLTPQIYLVMDYYHCDLKMAISQYTTQIVQGPLLQSELKGIVQQIIQGIQYIHDKHFIHRDMKPSNILVKYSNGTSHIAIADFGLTRDYDNNNNNSTSDESAVHMTVPVVTLWYRAPELLFGETQYTPSIDIWSIGCIMGELVRSSGYNNGDSANIIDGGNDDDSDVEFHNSSALLKGRGELDQIDAIFQLLGVPDDTTWPTFTSLPNAKLLKWKPIPPHDILFPKLFPSMDGTGHTTISLSNQTFLDHHGHDLLRKLLLLDPKQRINAAAALEHSYFTQGVQPKLPNFSFLI